MATFLNSTFSIRSLLADDNIAAEESENESVTSFNSTEPQSSEPTSSCDTQMISKNVAEAKPIYSYAALIYMAIKESPKHRLTLNCICTWIADNFSYYRNNKNVWQNSIRHCLSLSPYFVKIPRPLDDPGRGHYWALDPSVKNMTVGESTGRLRPKNNISANDVDTVNSKALLNYGTVYDRHPYHHTMAADMASVDAVYFPSLEEVTKFQAACYNYFQQMNQFNQ